MRVFLTGANGWIGSAVAQELLDAGHEVHGLVRSSEKAAELTLGVTAVLGGTGDLDVLRRAAEDADGVIHTAFGLDMTKMAQMSEEERRALDVFGQVFAGSNRPIVATGGVLLTPPGEVFSEDARPPVDPAFPRASEQNTFALADRGVHACVVRNPRSVHGQGETRGFVPMLAALAREKGFSAYVGDGQNLWPAVHRLDCARVYRLALERGAKPIMRSPSKAFLTGPSPKPSAGSSDCRRSRSRQSRRKAISAAWPCSWRATVRRRAPGHARCLVGRRTSRASSPTSSDPIIPADGESVCSIHGSKRSCL